MISKKTQIKAVFDADLEKVLKQTGQINEFVNNELKCAYCGTMISGANLSIIIPSVTDEQVVLHFCCNSLECLNKYRNGNK